MRICIDLLLNLFSKSYHTINRCEQTPLFYKLKNKLVENGQSWSYNIVKEGQKG
ncbi:hypothetical protein HMPREF3225_02408 [Staphylococcus lugdunensis]|uniref:Uncharacterized protein n=1 Tax=Staphylococcus lugdunensis TaxID=28035 RepID=A0ABD4ECB8_STALU|nr:hypothetical protein HMPREF3225_02408 [Staphylococcus lugdunensis]